MRMIWWLMLCGSCDWSSIRNAKKKLICCDKEIEYLLGAVGRFQNNFTNNKARKHKYEISAPSFELYDDLNKELLIKQKQLKLDVWKCR